MSKVTFFPPASNEPLASPGAELVILPPIDEMRSRLQRVKTRRQWWKRCAAERQFALNEPLRGRDTWLAILLAEQPRSEIDELRCYFGAFVEYVRIKRAHTLESLLISLGLVQTCSDANGILEELSGSAAQAAAVAERLIDTARERTDKDTLQVFKSMLEGKLRGQNLSYDLAISAYRRRRMLDATGATSECKSQRDVGQKILYNFAEMQRGRQDPRCKKGNANSLQRLDTVMHNLSPTRKSSVSFTHQGYAPFGRLKDFWRSVCDDHDLVPQLPLIRRENDHCQRLLSPSDVVHNARRMVV